MRRVAIAPRLIGMAAVTELDVGGLRHALTRFWPRAGITAMIVSLATI
jgi:hypothetical protein